MLEGSGPNRCSYCSQQYSDIWKLVTHPLWMEYPMCTKCRYVPSDLFFLPLLFASFSVVLPRCVACERKIIPNTKRHCYQLQICHRCDILRPVIKQSHAMKCFWEAVDFLHHYLAIDILPLLLSTSPNGFDRISNPYVLYDIPLASGGNPTAYHRILPTPRSPTTARLSHLDYNHRLMQGMLPEINALETEDLVHRYQIEDCNHNIDKTVVYGRCELRSYRSRSLGKKFRYVYSINCLKGLPEQLFTGHLIHELIHSFIFLSYHHRLDHFLEESLCDAAMICYLKKIRTTDDSDNHIQKHELCDFVERQLLTSNDDGGQTYRILDSLEKRKGVRHQGVFDFDQFIFQCFSTRRN